MPGGFFRVECDQMHDLISGLDQCEDQLRAVTKKMKSCTGVSMGSYALEASVGDLAGRMGDKIDKLSETVDGVLDRLKACVATYEKVDHGWADTFGGGSGGSGGTVGGAAAPGAGAAVGDAGGGISDALAGGGGVQPAPSGPMGE